MWKSDIDIYISISAYALFSYLNRLGSYTPPQNKVTKKERQLKQPMSFVKAGIWYQTKLASMSNGRS